jgi:hypothetical protein
MGGAPLKKIDDFKDGNFIVTQAPPFSVITTAGRFAFLTRRSLWRARKGALDPFI